MKSRKSWVLACKPNNADGRWHISFAQEFFPSFGDAAKKAFEYMSNGAPYLYRPALVEITPLETFEGYGEV